MAHRGDAEPRTATVARGVEPLVIGPADVTEFVNRMLSGNEELPELQVAALLAKGATVESIYCDLLGPAARRLGALWEDDHCDFLQVTVAVGQVQRIVRELATAFTGRQAHRDQPGSVLVTGLPDDHHSLGLLIAAEFFVRDGWAVNVGHPLVDAPIVEVVAGDWYDVIGASLALAERAPELRGMIRRLRKASRNPHVAVVVGGKAAMEDPDLAQTVGADGVVRDVREAPQVARAAMHQLRQGAGVPVTVS
jgi:methanogenic corrinoid protein MtbC1